MIKLIPDTEVDALLGKAQQGELALTELSLCARQLGLGPAELLNALSIEVAERFVQAGMPYAVGDDIMNGLFSAIFDLGMDGQMPQPAFDIYLAFDEGEYQHLGDLEHIIPSEHYTRSQLLVLLQGVADSA
ncbi:hypothetical protein KSS94_10450 [Pseudomonas fakonensis]|uniref:Uncharacterized protein n=1 Tax=Pseudomonas fakonensis TaxID=2842355 RepID=A0ABX8NAW5_9PSED|nr:hypothetical protein [Pseudomonas fakonensis]QXH53499.1 hypothetical protein KSS94_10450 [Pseudomonas fakonensis]